MVSIKCKDCGKRIQGRDEYTAELAFDRHCDQDHADLKKLTSEQLVDRMIASGSCKAENRERYIKMLERK